MASLSTENQRRPARLAWLFSPPADRSLPAARRRDWLELAAAFAIIWVFFRLLYSEVPTDDVALYAAKLEADKFDWKVFHIFLQPAALIWHRLFGDGADVVSSMAQINTLCAAIGLAVFYFLLCRLGYGLWLRIVVAGIAVVSFNILALAPTAHIKMLALPFLAVALYHAVLWEHEAVGGGKVVNWYRLTMSAAALGMSTAFLVTGITVLPFIGLGILLISHRAGQGWHRGLAPMVVFGAICCGIGAAAMFVGYVADVAQPGGLFDFIGYVLGQVAHKHGNAFARDFGLVDRLARGAYALVYNYVFTPDLGPVMRARLWGQISSLTPYAWELARDIVPFVLTIIVLGVTYLAAGLRMLSGGFPVVVPLAFLIGHVGFAITTNVNDPEIWFQVTFPTLLLFTQLPGTTAVAAAATVWLLVVGTVNLSLYAVPRALYPLSAHEADMQARFGGDDLIVHFTTYAGRPDISFFALPGIPRLKLDRALIESRFDPSVLPDAKAQIDRTLEAGGRVIAFRIFDERDWDAPWLKFAGRGMPKRKLIGFFREHYAVTPIGPLAGLDAWELTKRP